MKKKSKKQNDFMEERIRPKQDIKEDCALYLRGGLMLK